MTTKSYRYVFFENPSVSEWVSHSVSPQLVETWKWSNIKAYNEKNKLELSRGKLNQVGDIIGQCSSWHMLFSEKYQSAVWKKNLLIEQLVWSITFGFILRTMIEIYLPPIQLNWRKNSRDRPIIGICIAWSVFRGTLVSVC